MMAFASPPLHPCRSGFLKTGVSQRLRYGARSIQRSAGSSVHTCRRAVLCSANISGRGADQASATAEKEARIQLWREVEALKKSLTIAVNAERFSDAARLRDQIESLSLADEYFRTERELTKAVEEERYADAARLRDVLKVLDPPPGMAALVGEADVSTEDNRSSQGKEMVDMNPTDVSNSSTTVTSGIKVHVESLYMAEQSIPEQNRFLFNYKVTISNESDETCQLVSRHWVINSAVGPTTEARGPGVVGRQPVLRPGESFEYTSGCPITGQPKNGQSVLGSMQGTYHFCKGDTGDVKFDVNIDPFYLKLPFRNYRPSGPSSPGYPWPKP